MVNYNCDKCYKTFTQKSHYIQHQKRKNMCENNSDNQNIKKVKNIIKFPLTMAQLRNRNINQTKSSSESNKSIQYNDYNEEVELYYQFE